MTTQTRHNPIPPFRVRFVYDEDATPEGSNGAPLPEPEEHYTGNEYRDDKGQIVPYEEYLRHLGNPDRHVMIGAVLEKECACCGAWADVASLWGIDLMDDSAELRALPVIGTGGPGLATDDPRITGCLREIVDELMHEAK